MPFFRQPKLLAFGAGGSGSQAGVSYGATNEILRLTSPAVGTVPLTIIGAASQSANLQEWKDSTSAVLAYVSAAGAIGLGSAGAGTYIQSSNGIQLVQAFNQVAKFNFPNGNSTVASCQVGQDYIYVTKTLVNSTATSLFDINLSTLQSFGGELVMVITAVTATEVQTRTQIYTLQCVNKAGVYTKTATLVSETAAVSSGTLTSTLSFVDGVNKTTLKATAVSSLTPTTYRVEYYVRGGGVGGSLTLI